MVKVVARNRAGSYQRLVVMTEKEYEELRAASLLLPSKKTGPGNALVEKYLDGNTHPELSMSERLALFNQAVAREEAGRQFTDGRSAISTTKPQGMDAPTTKPQLVEVPDTTTTTTNTTTATHTEPTSSAADVKNEEEEEEHEQDKPGTILPNVRVPAAHLPKLTALTEILQASGTVSVDELGLVYIDRALLNARANYFDLMRSLFVHSKNDAKLVGRTRFLEHLHKLGVSAQHVSTGSAQRKLARLALHSKQEGSGGKTQRKTPEKHARSLHPPGKRPKILLMYR